MKISTESSCCFHQRDISDIKHFVRCEVWCYTIAGSTDQLEVMKEDTKFGGLAESKYRRIP